jgi:hypothetical protein
VHDAKEIDNQQSKSCERVKTYRHRKTVTGRRESVLLLNDDGHSSPP